MVRSTRNMRKQKQPLSEASEIEMAKPKDCKVKNQPIAISPDIEKPMQEEPIEERQVDVHIDGQFGAEKKIPRVASS